MKLGSDYLATGKLAPAGTQRFGDWAENQEHRLADLTLTVEFAPVSERRAAFAREDGEKLTEGVVRDFYLGKVRGWNIEDEGFSPLGLKRLLDLDVRIEDFIAHEVNALSRFLG